MESQQSRIKFLRKSLKLNQTEFAEKLGITYSTISKIETGSQLTDQNIRTICLTFGVSEQWLRTGEGDMFIDKTQQNIKELLDIFSRLSPASRKMILGLSRTMLSNEHPDTVSD
jgi:transcriptional regulator with XRE-family HTH domain